LALLSGAAIAVAGCGDETSHAGASDTTAVRVDTRVVTATMEPRRFAVSGVVEARNRVEVATRVSGRIAELPVTEGEPVREGQLLARLDAPELRAAADQARAAVDAARLAFEVASRQAERMERLADRDVVTRRDFELADLGREQARTALAHAETQQRSAESNLAYAILRAPGDGRVVERRARPGDLAVPGRPIVILVDDGEPEIRITVPADGSRRVLPGMAAEIAGGATALSGSVSRVVPSADNHITAAYVGIPGLDLPPGTYVSVTVFEDRETEVLRVPSEAVVRRGPLTGVFLVRDGRAVLRWLRLGDGEAVLAGLEPGESVVLNPPSGLTDGALVETTP
jgi:RND family efflux transporter MFP subunit